jgi:hypothetical protein
MNPITPKTNPNPNFKRISLVVACLLTGLLVGNIWMAAQLSHVGMYIKELDNRAQVLQRENTTLQQEVFQQASLLELEAIGQNQGYTSQIIYQQLLPKKSMAQVN